MDLPSNQEPFVRRLTECQSRLYAYILALLPDPTSANEVLSETNVTLWRKAAEFEEGTNFGAWAVRVAHFEILAFRKRRHNDRHVFDNDLISGLAEDAESVTEDLGEKRLALRTCLEQLSGTDRRIVRQRYEADTPVQEIASARGKSPGAISQALFRIRAHLADCIERTLRLKRGA